SVWFPVTHPGPYGPEPGTGGCGADWPMNSWITLKFSGTERISPPLGSPPSRQWRVEPPPVRNLDQPSDRKVLVDRSVVIGASRSLPMNGSFSSVPKLVSLPATACSTCWFRSARAKSVSEGSSLFFLTRE